MIAPVSSTIVEAKRANGGGAEAIVGAKRSNIAVPGAIVGGLTAIVEAKRLNLEV
ncbi:MAG: hypothetical protein LH702_33980 [Phormidesmis sp. CAN_BIN44]|nr:hypothetical protein [Phormidesmis sp. CAN_BIN44]